MEKVLFLPLLQIPSGHHEVINSMTHQLMKNEDSIQWVKVDILSYTLKYVEPLISIIYLKWIEFFPHLYHWIYQKSVYESLEKEKSFKLYELLFLRSMKKLIQTHNPTHIICSHALPSYLVSKLKQQGQCHAKLINVYTDFFIHHIWGTTNVDVHCISLPSMKEYLVQKGVDETSIYFTGIPVHEVFHNVSIQSTPKDQFHILVSGGSLGVCQIEEIFSRLPIKGHIHYHVLCGRNVRLFNRLSASKHPRISPYTFITSKEMLNRLYDQAHAVLTKPGGVTVSECLVKRKPIIIYDHLPGQEKINVDSLRNNGLITTLRVRGDDMNFESQLEHILTSEKFLNKNKKMVEKYHTLLIKKSPIDIIFHDLVAMK